MGELTNLSVIRRMMAESDFFFKKNLGQNFLADANTASKIVSAAIPGATGALEIGPGFGALTELLCEAGIRTVAVEADPFAFKALGAALAGREGLTLIHSDILRCDIAGLAESLGDKPVAVSNLPYYIASRIIGDLLGAGRFTSITVTVQKELAERICEEPKSRRRSAFGLFCEYKASCEMLFPVPRTVFYPSPGVDSELVRLTPRPVEGLTVEDEAFFLSTIKKAFAMRRKTLLNCFSSGFSLPRETVVSLMEKAGVDPSRRAETLDLFDFSRLAASFSGAL